MRTRIASLAISLVVFAFGLTAFVPSAFGCGTGQGGASCREATAGAVDLAALLDVIVRASSLLLP